MRIWKVKRARRILDRLLNSQRAIDGVVNSPKFLADVGLISPRVASRCIAQAQEYPRPAEDSIEEPERWDGLS
jgi:hypothetical protein